MPDGLGPLDDRLGRLSDALQRHVGGGGGEVEFVEQGPNLVGRPVVVAGKLDLVVADLRHLLHRAPKIRFHDAPDRVELEADGREGGRCAIAFIGILLGGVGRTGGEADPAAEGSGGQDGGIEKLTSVHGPVGDRNGSSAVAGTTNQSGAADDFWPAAHRRPPSRCWRKSES